MRTSCGAKYHNHELVTEAAFRKERAGPKRNRLKRMGKSRFRISDLLSNQAFGERGRLCCGGGVQQKQYWENVLCSAKPHDDDAVHSKLEECLHARTVAQNITIMSSLPKRRLGKKELARKEIAWEEYRKVAVSY